MEDLKANHGQQAPKQAKDNWFEGFGIISIQSFYFLITVNRGRCAPDSWVFGVINTATLLPILERCLQPGSAVYNDDWGVYNNHVVHHHIVVHCNNFVDPAPGVHPQEAESAWANLKLPIKGRRGIECPDLQSHLNDRMRRHWRGLDNIANFLPVLSSQYSWFSPTWP